jgi:hypothetical protein
MRTELVLAAVCAAPLWASHDRFHSNPVCCLRALMVVSSSLAAVQALLLVFAQCCAASPWCYDRLWVQPCFLRPSVAAGAVDSRCCQKVRYARLLAQAAVCLPVKRWVQAQAQGLPHVFTWQRSCRRPARAPLFAFLAG